MGRVSGGQGGLSERMARRLNTLERLRLSAAAAIVSNAEDLPVHPQPPAVTSAVTATAALTRVYPFKTNAALFRVSGGIPVENTTAPGYHVFPSCKIGNGVVPGGNLGNWTGDPEDSQTGWSVTFATDAETCEVLLRRPATGGRAYRLIVDGQYLDRAGIDGAALSGNALYVRLDFSALTPARKLRIVTVEGAGSNQHMFAQVAVGPTASIAHPGAGRTDLLAIFGGDSFTEGQNLPGINYHLAWPYRAAKRLGIPKIYDLAIGSTGYVATGPGGDGSRRRLVDQIGHDWNRPAFANPDLVVFANGYNDKDGTAASPAALAAVRIQARAAWMAARALFPHALFVVLGTFNGRNNGSADTLATENGIAAEFAAWGDTFALFLPVSTDPSPWQFGTGTLGSTGPKGDGNSDLTTGNDNVHPSDYGQDLISQRFCHALRAGIARIAS